MSGVALPPLEERLRFLAAMRDLGWNVSAETALGVSGIPTAYAFAQDWTEVIKAQDDLTCVFADDVTGRKSALLFGATDCPDDENALYSVKGNQAMLIGPNPTWSMLLLFPNESYAANSHHSSDLVDWEPLRAQSIVLPEAIPREESALVQKALSHRAPVWYRSDRETCDHLLASGALTCVQIPSAFLVPALLLAASLLTCARRKRREKPLAVAAVVSPKPKSGKKKRGGCHRREQTPPSTALSVQLPAATPATTPEAPEATEAAEAAGRDAPADVAREERWHNLVKSHEELCEAHDALRTDFERMVRNQFENAGAINQVHFYFTDPHPARRRHLQSLCRPDGYVNISVVLDFPQMKSYDITTDEMAKLLKHSAVVEVDEDGLHIKPKGVWATGWPCASCAPYRAPSRVS